MVEDEYDKEPLKLWMVRWFRVHAYKYPWFNAPDTIDRTVGFMHYATGKGRTGIILDKVMTVRLKDSEQAPYRCMRMSMHPHPIWLILIHTTLVRIRSQFYHSLSLRISTCYPWISVR